MGKFDPIMTKNYASLYLRIHSKDLIQTLEYDKAQYVDKNYSSEIFQKIFFWLSGEFWPECGPKLCKPISHNPL